MSQNNMSSDSLSNLRQPAKESGTRRVGFQHPISTSQTASHPTNTTADLPLPLEAAKLVSAGHITTLHIGLQSFLLSLTQSCLAAYSTYHNHNVKTKDLILHPLKIPPSVKALKLILQPLDELRESEGYQALQSDLNCEMELLHRKLVDKYIKPLNLMNSDAYLKRVQLAICALLRNASKAFIAQLNIINYSADEALIDLLASTPTDILTFPLPLDATSFLTLYKEANEDITQLPLPTEKNNPELEDIISKINSGHTILPPPPADREAQMPNPNTLRVNRDGQSPSSSITTNSQNGDPPQATGLSILTSTTSTTPSNRTTPHQSMDHNATAVTPGTAPPPLRVIQSPYAMRTNRQLITPGTETSVITETTLPPTTEATATHPGGHPPPFTGIRGTDFVPATSVMATQLTQTLLDNLEQSCSPIPRNESTPPDPNVSPNFSSQPELSELDLESITITTKKYELLMMLRKLYKQSIQLPIQEFHSTVTTREELQRIRQITTPILQNNLSAKVASKIQAERPADRPVLVGLIREENEKSLASLRQQLKSTADRLELMQQQQTHNSNTNIHHSQQIRTHRSTKNSRGGNTNKGRTGRQGASTVVAESLPSNPMSSTPSPSPPDQTWGRKRTFVGQSSTPSTTPPDQTWGRKRPFVGQSKPNEQNSTTAENNDSSTHRRRNNKQWKRSKRHQNAPT